MSIDNRPKKYLKIINKAFNFTKRFKNYSELINENNSETSNINQREINKKYKNKKKSENSSKSKKAENNKKQKNKELKRLFNENKTAIFDLKINNKNRMQEFIKLCMEGKLFDKTKYPLLPKPKITVIKPIFNGLKYLSYTLRSIQNQKMKDLEIIIVDDFSTEKGLIERIQKYQKEDPRIRLIKNKKEMGVLYTLCIGILNAKGEYILIIDQDDMYIDESLFEIIYGEIKSKEKEIDIVKFIRAQGQLNNLSLTVNPMSKSSTIYQPELQRLGLTARFARKDNETIDSNSYYDMIVKSEVYRKVVDIIGKKLYKRFMICYVDDLVTFLLFKVAKNYKKIEKFGMYKFRYKDSGSSGFFGEKKKIKHSYDLITFFDILYMTTKNNIEDKNLIAFKFTTCRRRYNITSNWFLYSKHVFSKYLNNPFINEKYKKEIQNVCLSLSKKQKKNKKNKKS